MTGKESRPWVNRFVRLPVGSIDLDLLAAVETIVLDSLRSAEEATTTASVEARRGSISHDSWTRMTESAAQAELVPTSARGTIRVARFEEGGSRVLTEDRLTLTLSIGWTDSWLPEFRRIEVGSRDIERLNSLCTELERTIRQHHRSKEHASVLTRVRPGPLYKPRLWWARQNASVQVGLSILTTLLLSVGGLLARSLL